MNVKQLLSVILFAVATSATFASYSLNNFLRTSTVAHVAPLPSNPGLSGDRYVIFNGDTYHITSTNGYVYVTDAYYNGGGNLTTIADISDVVDPTNFSVGYLLELSSSPTGTTISGDGNGFTANPSYDANYYDGQTEMYYSAVGALYIASGLRGDSNLYVEWYQWVDIAFEATNGKYVSATYGGGYPLYATATANGPWENYHACSSGGTAIDRVRGRLVSGDLVSLLGPGPNWVSAEAGSYNYVIDNRANAAGWEHFTISKTSGSGTINSNDTISMLSSESLYWTDASGSGDIINASQSSVGSSETFTITRN